MLSKDELQQLIEEAKQPIDFEHLVNIGALVQKGKSYYLGRKELLPDSVSRRIKDISITKNGAKVTFYRPLK